MARDKNPAGAEPKEAVAAPPVFFAAPQSPLGKQCPPCPGEGASPLNPAFIRTHPGVCLSSDRPSHPDQLAAPVSQL